MVVKITGDWVGGVVSTPFPGLTFGPFPAGQPKWIVLHGTAWNMGSAVAIGSSWQNADRTGTGLVSVHCIIDKDGTIVQGLSFKQTAWGNCCLEPGHSSFLPAGNQNFNTISIEHCKYNPSNADAITAAQSVSSFYLIKALCEAYGIPKEVDGIGDASKGGIIGHHNI